MQRKSIDKSEHERSECVCRNIGDGVLVDSLLDPRAQDHATPRIPLSQAIPEHLVVGDRSPNVGPELNPSGILGGSEAGAGEQQEPHGRVARRARVGRSRLLEKIGIIINEGVEEVALGFEVAIERAFAESGLSTHVLDAKVGVAPARETAPSRVDKPPSARRSIGFRDSRHASHHTADRK